MFFILITQFIQVSMKLLHINWCLLHGHFWEIRGRWWRSRSFWIINLRVSFYHWMPLLNCENFFFFIRQVYHRATWILIFHRLWFDLCHLTGNLGNLCPTICHLIVFIIYYHWILKVIIAKGIPLTVLLRALIRAHF